MKTMELRRVPYGTTFTAFGDQFVALDYIGGGVLAIRKETWKNVAFDSNGVICAAPALGRRWKTI